MLPSLKLILVMGNVSGRRDGAGSSGIKKHEEGEHYMDFAQGMAQGSNQAPALFPDTIVHLPPPLHSPMEFLSPLMFTPQVPMIILPNERMQTQSYASMHNATEYEDVPYEQRIPNLITWSHGGKQVAVEGSWDNWTTKEALEISGEDFVIMKVLPSGVYYYRFMVDGHWRYSPDFPWAQDDMGRIHNILDLQDYVPEAIQSRTVFESPSSPESSYNNNSLDSSFYEKDPPSFPPQLHMTLLNMPSSPMEQSLPRPNHAALNHLCIREDSNNRSVVAVGSTHRFLGKYVTVELYKSIQRYKK